MLTARTEALKGFIGVNLLSNFHYVAYFLSILRKIDFGRPFLQAAAGSKELRDRPVAHAGVVDLYPLVVQVHWCTSFGVSTSKSTNRVLCCGCCLVDGDGCGGTDSGTVDANSRGSSPASAAAAAVTCSARGVGRTGASCCSADDILTRFVHIVILRVQYG